MSIENKPSMSSNENFRFPVNICYVFGGSRGLKILGNIERLDEPTNYSDNCFQFTFGVGSPDEVAGVLETLNKTDYKPDVYAVYFNDTGVSHVGRVTEDGRVLSKWSVGEDVFVHPIWLIPRGFGNRVEFYE